MKKFLFSVFVIALSSFTLSGQDSYFAGLDVSGVLVDSDPSSEAPSSRMLMLEETASHSFAFITAARLKPLEALVVSYGKNRSFYLVNHEGDSEQQFVYSFMDKVKSLSSRPVHYHVVQLAKAQFEEMKKSFRTEEIDNGNGSKGMIVKVK